MGSSKPSLWLTTPRSVVEGPARIYIAPNLLSNAHNSKEHMVVQHLGLAGLYCCNVAFCTESLSDLWIANIITNLKNNRLQKNYIMKCNKLYPTYIKKFLREGSWICGNFSTPEVSTACSLSQRRNWSDRKAFNCSKIVFQCDSAKNVGNVIIETALAHIYLVVKIWKMFMAFQ